jgi:hypothetical protein
MFVPGIILLAGGAACLAYGLIEVFAPALPIRWQVNVTAKHRRDFRAVIGLAFQRWLSVDRTREPWDDPVLRRKIRLIGGTLVIGGAICIAAGVWILTR